jgi:hypothetical protein
MPQEKEKCKRDANKTKVCEKEEYIKNVRK